MFWRENSSETILDVKTVANFWRENSNMLKKRRNFVMKIQDETILEIFSTIVPNLGQSQRSQYSGQKLMNFNFLFDLFDFF